MAVSTRLEVDESTLDTVHIIKVTDEHQGWMVKVLAVLRAVKNAGHDVPWMEEYENLAKKIKSAHKGQITVTNGVLGAITKEKPEDTKEKPED